MTSVPPSSRLYHSRSTPLASCSHSTWSRADEGGSGNGPGDSSPPTRTVLGVSHSLLLRDEDDDDELLPARGVESHELLMMLAPPLRERGVADPPSRAGVESHPWLRNRAAEVDDPPGVSGSSPRYSGRPVLSRITLRPPASRSARYCRTPIESSVRSRKADAARSTSRRTPGCRESSR